MATKDLTVRILGDASNFNKALAGIGNSASTTGAKLTSNLTPAAAAVGVAMGRIGSEWNNARDAIITGTGASGQALDGLMTSSRRVAGSVPNDFGAVGQAIADVNTRLGLTGPELEGVSEKALNLSRVTKTDLSANIRASARVVRDWGLDATEAGDVMDLMFAASQQTGIGFDQLGDKVVQFGAPLRQVGFTMEESIALLAGFEAQGVNTENVMSGLRQSLGRMAQAGEEPTEAFARLSDEIKNAGTAGEANILAIELFGSRAGPDMAAAIREGRFEIDDLVASLSNSGGSIDDAADATLRFSDRLKMFRNRIVGVLGPFGEIGGIAGGAVASLGPLLFGLGQMAPILTRLRNNLGRVGSAFGVAGVAMAAYAIHASQVQQRTEAAAAAIDDLSRASDAELVSSFSDALMRGVLAGDGFAGSLENIARTAPGSLQRMVDMEEASGGLTAQFVEQGLSTEEAAEWVAKVGDALEAEKGALDNAEKSASALTDSTDDLTDSTEAATDATEAAEQADDERTESIRRNTEAQEAARQATDDLRNATLASIDSSLGYRNQVADTTEAIAAANETMATAEVGTDDYAQAARDAEGAALQQAAAAVRLAEDQATASGSTFDAQQKTDTYIAELVQLKDTLNGDAAIAIQMHINRLNAIPRSVNTSVYTSIPSNSGFRGVGTSGYRPEGAGATGAIINRPTVLLAGEKGPEALIPLNKTPGNGPLPAGMPSMVNHFYGVQDPEDAIRRFEVLQWKAGAR